VFLTRDFLGRATLTAAVSIFATLKGITIVVLVSHWDKARADEHALAVLCQIVGLAFMLVVSTMTVFRLNPRHSAHGWEPRVSALAGTFLMLLLGLTDPVMIHPSVTSIGLLLIVVGLGLATYVMLWLGQSFSVMAQARRLVTSGPYRIVRHPLYLVEEIAGIGMMLLSLSPTAVLILMVHFAFQLRRMVNEERVLGQAFPEYAVYAARTPMLIPLLVPAVPSR
jgi:protein-S-isoprenylcysteine O-methyltransferase Ste14